MNKDDGSARIWYNVGDTKYAYNHHLPKRCAFMPTVKQETVHGLSVYVLDNDQMTAWLCPELGNNVYRLYDKIADREVLLVPDSLEALRQQPGSAGTPLMLPPNRLRHGKFSFGGRDYQFDVQQPGVHHSHGFLRNHPWTVVRTETTDTQCSVTSLFDTSLFPDILKQYPHALKIEVTYTLCGSSLVQTAVIANDGDEPAPVGYGLHTWFLIDGEPEKWSLTLPVEELWELTEDKIPTGRRLPLGDYESLPTGMKLQGSDMDTVFQIGRNPRTAVLAKEGYSIRYTASEAYLQWVIYTKGKADRIICLEPYTWVTNAPNIDAPAEITGLRAVSKGEPLELTVTLEVVR